MARRKQTGKRGAEVSVAPKAVETNLRPYLKYVGIFATFMVLFQSLCLLPQAEIFIGWLAVAYARISAVLLSGIGVQATAEGATLFAGKAAILTVERACSCIEFCITLLAAVLAFPCSWRKKAIGLSFGLAALMTINVLRVASLYWVGINNPGVFHRMHEHWWSIGITLTTVCILAGWMALASEQPKNVVT